MKKKILAVLICCLTALSLFGLAGCGDTSLKSLAENFENLDKAYADNSQAFVQDFDYISAGAGDQIYVKYKVKLGNAKDHVDQSLSGSFQELETLYGAAFAISTDYIEDNREYITQTINEKDLTKEAHGAINELNDSLNAYIQEIKTFAKARNSFVDYFEGFGVEVPNVDTQKAELTRFKKAYGALVEKNITLSTKLAEAVESTGIFELLQKIDLQASDTGIVKEFVRAKILPVFTRFQIGTIANNMNWDEAENLDRKTKARISNIINKLKEQFDYYVKNFVVADSHYEKLAPKAMKDLFSLVEEFLAQTDDYFQSLEGLNIQDLALNHGNNLAEYQKINKLAEVYLKNMEKFAGTILPDFLVKLQQVVFGL